MNRIIVNKFGGGTPRYAERRQCVRFAVSETSERRFEAR